LNGLELGFKNGKIFGQSENFEESETVNFNTAILSAEGLAMIS
jgi:hypothetical protein